ncbi:hypothetical protein K9B35_07690 [Sphingomonas sp. R647]|uniref:hypothetical protein n=1 Tax=Sphingomonas sp. R647 TaxID=2875233 RepID=UPI001CD47BCE|nr:hypothetical protein [Sphingomonas sp. R647]MCA1197845.1 hypothetical protein [Sphingomonas sp. R647]
MPWLTRASCSPATSTAGARKIPSMVWLGTIHPSPNEADEWRKILVERRCSGRLFPGVLLETDLTEVVLVLLGFYGRRLPGAPTGTVDDDREFATPTHRPC